MPFPEKLVACTNSWIVHSSCTTRILISNYYKGLGGVTSTWDGAFFVLEVTPREIAAWHLIRVSQIFFSSIKGKPITPTLSDTLRVEFDLQSLSNVKLDAAFDTAIITIFVCGLNGT